MVWWVTVKKFVESADDWEVFYQTAWYQYGIPKWDLFKANEIAELFRHLLWKLGYRHDWFQISVESSPHQEETVSDDGDLLKEHEDDLQEDQDRNQAKQPQS